MLNYDTILHPHHTDDTRLYNFSKPIAKVNQHPTNPGIWGLQNLSQVPWISTTAQGVIRNIEPERTLPLEVGTKVSFGTAEGEIRR